MIGDFKLVEKVFKNGRWFAVLSESLNGTRTIPFANYVWLTGNPCFESIPKGYVIHHLDYDPTNDDITNLVLMQKHHHAAHHWKNKTIKPELNVKIQYDSVNRTGYSPIRKPSIHKRKDVEPEWWTVSFRENINGKNERTFVSKDFDGKRFSNREEAEKFVCAIWRE
ncbi:MAG: HNH endonuclease [Desulfobacterales bacterium]|jgi:hypothetical protein|nr:HNH endonuclease [Desulfobacterales bacterium]